MAGNTLGKLFIDLFLRDEQFQEAVGGAEKRVKRFSKSMNDASKAISGAFVGAVGAAKVAVAGFTAAAAQVGAAFEEQIVTVGALRGLERTDQAFQDLTDRARELGSSTAFSATEAAEGMQNLVRAGFDAKQTVEAIGPALKFAGAAGATLDQSTSVLASSLKQFSLEADQATRITDVFAVALKESKFDISSLDQAMRQGAPQAALFGNSIEETTAILAQFVNMGLEGSVAGRNLRGMLSSLAKPTDEAVAALKDMGLTLEDVHPATNKAVDIIHKLGDAGMRVDQALAIFGRQFGGQIAAVVQQVADGTSTMDSLNEMLGESAGSAAAMYDQMMDTVSGRFKEAKSAVEELMISVFDQFSGPLTSLLQQMARTIAHVADFFNHEAGRIGAGFEKHLGRAEKWLEANKNEIAAAFLFATESVVDLLSALGKLAKILPEIALAMKLIFAVNIAMRFYSATMTVIQGLVGLKATLAALRAELTVTTGGIFLLVTAFGAVVAALHSVTKGYFDAKRAARSWSNEQSAIEAASKEATDRILKKYKEEIFNSKILESQQRKELAAAGKLTDARRDELNLIRRLTKDELALSMARGEMVEHEGFLRTVRSLYEELHEDAVPVVTERIQELQAELGRMEGKARRIENLHDELKKYSKHAADATARTQGFKGGMEELAAAVGSYDEEIQRAKKAIRLLKAENDDAQASLLQGYAESTDAAGELADAIRDMGDTNSKERKKEEKTAVETAERAMQAAIDARRGESRALEDALADKATALSLSHRRELRSLQEKETGALDAAKDSGTATVIVTAEFSRARTSMEARHARERTRFDIDQRQEALDAARRAFEKEAAARAATRSAMQNIDRDGLSESKRLTLERSDFFAKHENLTADERARAEEWFQGRIKDARKQERQEAVQSAQDTIARAADVARKVAGFAKQIVSGVVGATTKAFKVVGDVFGRIASAAKDAVGSVFGALTGGDVQIDPLDFVKQGVDQAAEEGGSVADAAVSFVQEMAANAGSFIAGMVDALPAVIDALVAAIPEIVAAFVDALPAVVAALVEAIPEIVSALASAMPEIIDAIAALLPDLVNALAGVMPQIVEVLAQAVPDVIAVFAENLPTLLEALAQQLPQIIAILAEAIPSIVEVFVENLPTVIEAIAAALPDLISVVAEQIPVLVQALVDQLPVIVDALIESIPPIFDAIMEALPILVDGLVKEIPRLVLALLDALLEMVPVLIEQLVVIVEALMELLPQVIDMILAALPDIISALMDAIPRIVQSVLDAIPKIISGIIHALPDIIESLVSQFPHMITDLVLSLTKAIPEIAIAFTKALFTELIPLSVTLPVIMVKELGLALWDLIKGLVQWIADWFRDLFSIGKDKSSSYSGISYVPATMRGVTLHAGEAVLTADENARRQFGGAAGAGQTNPGAPVITPESSGESGATEVLFGVDGRVMDGAIVRANRNGKGQITRMMTKRAGVTGGTKSHPRRSNWSG